MLLLVAYDIPDNRARTRLFKLLRRFGEPLQYSVFQCDISRRQFLEMRTAVKLLLLEEERSVRYYEICQPCSKRAITLGMKAAHPSLPIYIA